MKKAVFASAVLSGVLALAAMQSAAAANVTAQAKLAPTKDSKVSGLVTFEQTADGVHVKAKVEGLTPGDRKSVV